MNQMNRRTWLCRTLTLLAGGCASYAVRPPTPATNLNLDLKEPPPPCEHFYILVFGSQRVPKTPPYTHSFATVVHTFELGPGEEKVVDFHTISWMPATLKIIPSHLHPEPGVNLDLYESLDNAIREDERISLWGPYECRPSVYKRFLVQKHFLESGAVGYQCVDNVGESARQGNGCACIHAITDMDPEYGRENYPLIWYGDAASEHIVHRLRDADSLLNPDLVHDHLNKQLGLNVYRIVHRQLGDRLLDFPRIQPANILGR
jgi:hypothetical protein